MTDYKHDSPLRHRNANGQKPMEVTPRQPDSLEQVLRTCASRAQSRLDLWVDLIQSLEVQRMAEIGVYRGDFAAAVLQRCQRLTSYYMIDPWRHLPDWNKPANASDDALGEIFREASAKTDFAHAKRVILRGKTTEVIDQIPDAELDLAYLDADHTLKGIAIDLIRVFPKVRPGGFLGGDDFTRSVWGHQTDFEPTLVFPFAVYFAEAVGATIYALPFSQFCLQKTHSQQFAFVDLTGQYDNLGLRDQFAPEKIFKLAMWKRLPLLMEVARKTRDLLRK